MARIDGKCVAAEHEAAQKGQKDADVCVHDQPRIRVGATGGKPVSD
jgi:hypothetical protein